MERIALTLHGATSSTGRRPREVVDAVRVDFTGFRAGSAVLDLGLPPAPDGGALVEEALETLASGVDSVDVSVTCTFDETLAEAVLTGLNQFVIASGIGEFAAVGGALRSLDLSRLDVVEQAPEADLQQLVREQGVRPWGDGPTDPIGERAALRRGVRRFLRGALSARGEV